MAIPAANTMTQTDELPGEVIEFSIGDPRWVMRSQSDLYSNRELAVVREYSTNAFDANKQKALDEGTEIRPIEVTLPSMMNPYFKVRDYGYGMTRDILADVYTKFGTSTKRDSNHFNGMLGYGSKSAVAYSTQFTVTSVAEGIKTVAVITRKPDWAIVMKIVSKEKSSDPSGTEVIVPVHNHEEFRQKAMDFYRFWMPGTVEVNGEYPEHHVGELITEGFYASPEYGTSYVVMGNVPYRIENPAALFWNTKMNQIHFVAYVDNGQVEFTPSREDLKYTDLTKNTLKNVIAEFSNEIIVKAKADIDTATTHAEAYKAWSKWRSTLGERLFEDLEFKGEKFTSRFKVDAYQYRYGTRGGSRNIRDWNVESAHNTLFILGNPAGDPSSSKKAKAQEYKTLKNLKSSYTLFVREDEVDCVWLDTTADNYVSWDDLVKALPVKPKAPRIAGGRLKNIRGSFDMYSIKGFHAEQELDDDYEAENFFYLTPGDRKSYDYQPSQILQNLPGDDNGDLRVVMVGANRLAKFKRENPGVEEFLTWAKTKIVKDGESLLNKDSKDVMSVDYSDKCWVERLDAKRVDDPEILRYIGLVKGTPDKSDYDRNIALAQSLKMWSYVKTWEPKKEREILKHYPLLVDLSYYKMHEHVYLYLNAAYAARKDKK